MAQDNTERNGVPIQAGMRMTNSLVALSALGGLVCTLVSVAIWSIPALIAVAVAFGMVAVFDIQWLRKVRDRELPPSEHRVHEDRVLFAAMAAVFYTSLCWAAALVAMGAGVVWINLLGVLPGFAFYMYLIFGVTNKQEQTVFDFFIKQPQAIVNSGLEPIKAAGEMQRAKDARERQ